MSKINRNYINIKMDYLLLACVVALMGIGNAGWFTLLVFTRIYLNR